MLSALECRTVRNGSFWGDAWFHEASNLTRAISRVPYLLWFDRGFDASLFSGDWHHVMPVIFSYHTSDFPYHDTAIS